MFPAKTIYSKPNVHVCCFFYFSNAILEVVTNRLFQAIGVINRHVPLTKQLQYDRTFFFIGYKFICAIIYNYILSINTGIGRYQKEINVSSFYLLIKNFLFDILCKINDKWIFFFIFNNLQMKKVNE